MNSIQQDALSNARNGQSFANYPAIFAGFTARGIPESDILPRENVLSFHAWKALGRVVRKGEHGVKICTFVPMSKKDGDGNEHQFKAARSVTVFHVSQTEPLNGEKSASVAPKQSFTKPAPLSGESYYSNEFTEI